MFGQTICIWMISYVVWWSIRALVHKSSNEPKKTLSWPVNTSTCVPNRTETRFKMTLATNSDEFWGKTTSSIHLLKFSTITKTYFAPHDIRISGPAKSKFHQYPKSIIGKGVIGVTRCWSLIKPNPILTLIDTGSNLLVHVNPLILGTQYQMCFMTLKSHP